MKGELDALIAYLEKHFVFDETHYPELKGADEQYRFDYGVRHLALHIMKFGGKIGAVSEDKDHGGDGDVEKLKESVPRLLITTLRLAGLLKMSEADLIDAIEKKYKAKLENGS
jgi:hypothetical protein